jgi:hypothetical protein
MARYEVIDSNKERDKIRPPTAAQIEEMATFGQALEDVMKILDNDTDIRTRSLEGAPTFVITREGRDYASIGIYTTKTGYTTIYNIEETRTKEGMDQLRETSFIEALCNTYEQPILHLVTSEEAVQIIHEDAQTTKAEIWQQAQKWYATHGWASFDPGPYAFAGAIVLNHLYEMMPIGPSAYVKATQRENICKPLNIVPIGNGTRFQIWKNIYQGVGEALHNDQKQSQL